MNCSECFSEDCCCRAEKNPQAFQAHQMWKKSSGASQTGALFASGIFLFAIVGLMMQVQRTFGPGQFYQAGICRVFRSPIGEVNLFSNPEHLSFSSHIRKNSSFRIPCHTNTHRYSCLSTSPHLMSRHCFQPKAPSAYSHCCWIKTFEDGFSACCLLNLGTIVCAIWDTAVEGSFFSFRGPTICATSCTCCWCFIPFCFAVHPTALFARSFQFSFEICNSRRRGIFEIPFSPNSKSQPCVGEHMWETGFIKRATVTVRACEFRLVAVFFSQRPKTSIAGIFPVSRSKYF